MGPISSSAILRINHDHSQKESINSAVIGIDGKDNSLLAAGFCYEASAGAGAEKCFPRLFDLMIQDNGRAPCLCAVIGISEPEIGGMHYLVNIGIENGLLYLFLRIYLFLTASTAGFHPQTGQSLSS